MMMNIIATANTLGAKNAALRVYLCTFLLNTLTFCTSDEHHHHIITLNKSGIFLLLKPPPLFPISALSLSFQCWPSYNHLRLRYLYTHLVFSIDDSTKAIIQRKVESMQRFIREDREQVIQISSMAKRHFQLQIETLQNAPRDVSKLQQIIKAKERENKEEARHIDDTVRLVTEIEMLKVVLHLLKRRS
jgi:hypothetical protein